MYLCTLKEGIYVLWLVLYYLSNCIHSLYRAYRKHPGDQTDTLKTYFLLVFIYSDKAIQPLKLAP